MFLQRGQGSTTHCRVAVSFNCVLSRPKAPANPSPNGRVSFLVNIFDRRYSVQETTRPFVTRHMVRWAYRQRIGEGLTFTSRCDYISPVLVPALHIGEKL